MSDISSRRSIFIALTKTIRIRHATFWVGSLLVLSATIAIWGQNILILPGDFETLPLAVLMPVPYACVAASTFRSSMHDFERVSALKMDAIDLLCLVCASTVAVTAAGVGLFLGNATELIPLVLRNIVFWTGIGCFSAVIFGRSLSWILPIFLFVPLYESGRSGMGGQVPWWAIARQPTESGWSWIATIIVFGLGMISVRELSVWRRGVLGRLGSNQIGRRQ